MMHLDELAYIVIGSAKLDDWREYGTQILGAMVDDGPGGALHIKLDEWHYRILIVPDAEERFVACGWGTLNARAYQAVLEEARAHGVDLVEATAQECQERMVAGYFRFTDPANNAHEICWGRTMDAKPFISPVAVERFVTGRLGMGHVVLPCTGDYDAALAFYQNVMGLDYSDYFARATAPGTPLKRVHFFHCQNARQHSLALGEFAAPGGINHFMVEVETLDDVGRCVDRIGKSKFKLGRSLGRHVNDSVYSIYIVTPGGFMTEYGFGGELMDWSNHEVRNISAGTYWGHEWQPGILGTPASITGGQAAPKDDDVEFRKSIPG